MARILLPSGCSYSQPNVFPKNWKTVSASTKKHWYITYRFYDPDQLGFYPKGKLVMVKGMNDYPDVSQRRAATSQILKEIADLLEVDGYNPITQTTQSVSAPSELRTAPVMPQDGFWRGIIFARTNNTYTLKTAIDVDSYLRRVLKAALALNLHTKPLGDFERRDLLSILAFINSEKEWTRYSYNNCLGYLSGIFTILNTWQAMNVNPVTGIPKKTGKKSMREVLNQDQRVLVDKMLKKADQRFWLFINMFFHSGAREIEFLNIQLVDVDLEKQTFIVTVRKGRDKTPRREIRPIKNVALPFWKEYLLDTEPGKFLFARGWVPGPKPMTRDWLTHLWGKIVKKGLKIDIDLYSLKHLNFDETTALTDMSTAAKQAGHTTIEMGKKYYAVGEEAREMERLKKVGNTFA